MCCRVVMVGLAGLGIMSNVRLLKAEDQEDLVLATYIEVMRPLLSAELTEQIPAEGVLREIGAQANAMVEIRGSLGNALRNSFSQVPLAEGIRRVMSKRVGLAFFHFGDAEGSQRVYKIIAFEVAPRASGGVVTADIQEPIGGARSTPNRRQRVGRVPAPPLMPPPPPTRKFMELLPQTPGTSASISR